MSVTSYFSNFYWFIIVFERIGMRFFWWILLLSMFLFHLFVCAFYINTLSRIFSMLCVCVCAVRILQWEIDGTATNFFSRMHSIAFQQLVVYFFLKLWNYVFFFASFTSFCCLQPVECVCFFFIVIHLPCMGPVPAPCTKQTVA